MPLKASEARSKNKKPFQYAKKSAPGYTGGVKLPNEKPVCEKIRYAKKSAPVYCGGVKKPKPKSAGLRLPVKRSASGFDGGVTKK